MKTCPSCGSHRVVRSETKDWEIFIGDVKIVYDKVEDHCQDCDDRGDFGAENDGRIEKAIKKAGLVKLLCPECEVSMYAELVGWIERTFFKGKEFRFNACAYRCTMCDELFDTAETMDRSLAAARAALKEDQ